MDDDNENLPTVEHLGWKFVLAWICVRSGHYFQNLPWFDPSGNWINQVSLPDFSESSIVLLLIMYECNLSYFSNSNISSSEDVIMVQPD